jgi:P pilus assembly chaperone PapD
MNMLIKPGLMSFILMMVSARMLPAVLRWGATRVIYPADAKQTSLAITNSNKQERYLINAWIENAKRAERRKPLPSRRCLLASRTVKTRCVLFTPGQRCLPIASRSFT